MKEYMSFLNGSYDTPNSFQNIIELVGYKLGKDV